jgi:hypothetical protein
MSLEIEAALDVIDMADAMGVEVPDDLRNKVTSAAVCGGGSYPARAWAAEHPDDPGTGCCWGAAMGGPEDCTCWVAEYDQDQQPPRPIVGVAEAVRQPRMCGDCAYRPDSPERTLAHTALKLEDLPLDGSPFWCHQGIRRPVEWRHPDGRTMPGAADDYQPPMVAGVPYQADGSPARLCAGWAVRRDRVLRGG